MPLPRILLVDDNKAVRTLARQVLAPFACTVTEAPNGLEALFAMDPDLPDLIVLDINMPRMGGVEMLTMLKSKPKLAAIPVLMLASPTDHPTAGKIAALGVQGTLIKPFAPAELLEKIQAELKLTPR
jgi:CheY-like chemotaxis protein